jgi:hypothetical protein
VSGLKEERLTVVIPHTSLHDVRTPLLRTFGREVWDILVVYDKAVLNLEDYPQLKYAAEEKLKDLRGKRVGLILGGSYAACLIVYRTLMDLGCEVLLLQYDPRLRRYVEVRT